MGKKSRLKKERREMAAAPKTKLPSLMDPKLIEAYTKGRSVGLHEGKVEGVAETMTLFDKWIDEIDQHIKGIGPKKKLEIEMYLGDRIKEVINNNKMKSVTGKVIKDIPKASNQ